MTTQLPTALQAEDQAKRLRTKMAKDGTPIGHARSLELVSQQYGFRDWDAMIAAVGNGPQKDWVTDDKLNCHP